MLGTECGGAGCPRPRTGCGWRGGPLCGSCHVSHVTHVSTATISRTRAGHAHCSALATSGPQHSQPRHLKQITCLQSDKLQQYYCADNGGVRYSLEVSTIFREYVYNILIMPAPYFTLKNLSKRFWDTCLQSLAYSFNSLLRRIDFESGVKAVVGTFDKEKALLKKYVNFCKISLTTLVFRCAVMGQH